MNGPPRSRQSRFLARSLGGIALLLALGPNSPASGDDASWDRAAQANLPADATPDWEFFVTPYLWLPTFTGTAAVSGIEADVDTSFWKVLSGGGFAIGLMAQFETRWKRKWGLILDGTWMYVRQNNNLKNSFLEFDSQGNIGYVEVFGVYRIGEGLVRPRLRDGATWSLDGMVGSRVSILNASLDFTSDSTFRPSDFDETEVWADLLLGGRAEVRFGPDNRVRFELRSDFGGLVGGSDFTWNVVGTFGYSFHIRTVPVEIQLAGRALHQDFKTDGGDFKWDVTAYGPILALSFAF
jgi:hypothetical protein